MVGEARCKARWRGLARRWLVAKLDGMGPAEIDVEEQCNEASWGSVLMD